ncbi:MAG: GAF domain-containing protein [Anaerolineales bacterium]|nr:GAF domain-containing protein [Anaerolineales bacterium]
MDTSDTFRFLQAEVVRLREENRELKGELIVAQASVRALCALQAILEKLHPEQDVLSLLNEILASALTVVGASDGSLLLLDDQNGDLVFAVVHGQARSQLTGFRIPPGKGIAGWVAANRQPDVVRDVHLDPRFYSAVDETFGFLTRSLACVPLHEGDKVLGVIEAINKSSDRDFTPQDLELLQLVALLASIALARAEKYAESAASA